MATHTANRLRYIQIDEVWYVSSPCFSGDRPGCDPIDRANARFLEKREIGWEYHEDGEVIFPLPEGAKRDGTSEIEELLLGLENYPLCDEGIYGEIEMEEEEKAWKDWLRADLVRGLPKNLADELAERPDWDDLQWEAYRHAKEVTNTYGHLESDGYYIRVKDLDYDFSDYLERHWLAMEGHKPIKEFLRREGMPVPDQDEVGASMLMDLMEEKGEKRDRVLFVREYWPELFRYLVLVWDEEEEENPWLFGLQPGDE